jgi:hypothetical protein
LQKFGDPETDASSAQTSNAIPVPKLQPVSPRRRLSGDQAQRHQADDKHLHRPYNPEVPEQKPSGFAMEITVSHAAEKSCRRIHIVPVEVADDI